jgi:hypothetical protein
MLTVSTTLVPLSDWLTGMAEPTPLPDWLREAAGSGVPHVIRAWWVEGASSVPSKDPLCVRPVPASPPRKY